ncbi:hypothetical protein CUMW_083430 [Citrus unshiu]|nr:hypothetical protein CUMW_083430 [Citrus unshiu]
MGWVMTDCIRTSSLVPLSDSGAKLSEDAESLRGIKWKPKEYDNCNASRYGNHGYSFLNLLKKKKVHSFQALKELPREITQVATKFGIAKFELATMIVKDTLELCAHVVKLAWSALIVEILVPIEEIVSDSFFLKLTFELKSFDFNYNF